MDRKRRYEAAVDYVYGGLSQMQVAKKYRVSQSEISLLFDPIKRAAKHRRQRAEYARDLPTSRAKQAAKRKKLRSTWDRFRLAIHDSKGNAARGGYAPIDATPEKIKLLLLEQNYQCIICKAVDGSTLSTRLRPDHCHATGRFRGWLCHRCNTGIHVIETFPDRTLKYLRVA